jgi:hypothetical protein
MMNDSLYLSVKNKMASYRLLLLVIIFVYSGTYIDQPIQAMKKNVFAIICMMSVMSCSEKSKLPKEKYYQFEYTANYTYNHDTLTITISNPLNCPLRVSVSSVDKTVKIL